MLIFALVLRQTTLQWLHYQGIFQEWALLHKISLKTNISINEKLNYPGLDISESIEPVKQVKEILNNSNHKKVIFGTEGGLFKKELNIPTIVCGPGSIDQAHKPDEYISIQQIEKGGIFIDKLINNYS